MRTNSIVTAAISAGSLLGIVMLSDTTRAEESTARHPTVAQVSPATGQQKVAEATLNLENAFAEQFVRGKIDRNALSPAIDEVVAAMPEAARPKVQEHIDSVLQLGERLASQMTPEQRAEAAAPPASEKVGKTEQAQVAAWGWPGFAGWGGIGAFGFPAMFGVGWGTSAAWGWSSGFATACGLGCGGWFW
jgi:hypothetical protein